MVRTCPARCQAVASRAGAVVPARARSADPAPGFRFGVDSFLGPML